MSRLAQIHADAVETARLANLLGRSLHATIAIAALAALALALGGGAGFSQTVAWTVLLAVGLLAMLRAYAFAIRQPFERAGLHAFAQDIHASLLYAGFAWGGGRRVPGPARVRARRRRAALRSRTRHRRRCVVARAAGAASVSCAPSRA
ncbi:MAG: hypothetical protein WDM81_12295 [Rhizomicrobium sp.]